MIQIKEQTPAKPAFKVWKTIKIGTFKKTTDLKFILLQNGCLTGNSTEKILTNKNFKISTEQKKIDLVLVTASDLGFEKDQIVGFKELSERSKEFGLKVCPDEVGPQLRLQYKDQPKMDRVEVPFRKNLKFIIENIAGLWLLDLPIGNIHPNEKLVFWIPNDK